ncbi:DNA-3-methyladenine glycosylase 2 family protein [Halobacillus shinanisalinarum]|uniref:DNA-3-methyladenine glycosylase II n=1 Tax=Halobacillus shinanisalinarum TaxID=2932258 RepID=A0ABY4GWA4_9BACI|nr:DNA-3-methyladenine glycosylase 2 family protein [Halobacillus shinanisalinarum]UOQ92190.1 DNA-3-methyladenine glycosylase 2 family protein [Halobacillus shinanisalinarum]
MDKLYFTLEDDRIKHLSQIDPELNNLIKVIGTIDIPLKTDYHRSIVKQIIGQQLSLKAAHTINTRLEEIWPNLQPELLEGLSDEQIRSVGVSRAKLKYIRELTEKHLSNEVDFSSIHLLEDEEVIKTLTDIKGIGRWTAEMFLIFSLGRLNVLSYGDVSIKNSIRWLYQMEKDEPLDLDFHYKKWEPFNSIVSLYLWNAINLGIVKGKPPRD